MFECISKSSCEDSEPKLVLEATFDLAKVYAPPLLSQYISRSLRHARDARPAHLCMWQARLEDLIDFLLWHSSTTERCVTVTFRLCGCHSVFMLFKTTLRSMVKGDMAVKSHRERLPCHIGCYSMYWAHDFMGGDQVIANVSRVNTN